jgi:hypothetical protein
VIVYNFSDYVLGMDNTKYQSLVCRISFIKHMRNRNYTEIKMDSGAGVCIAANDDYVICHQDNDNAPAAA